MIPHTRLVMLVVVSCSLAGALFEGAMFVCLATAATAVARGAHSTVVTAAGLSISTSVQALCIAAIILALVRVLAAVAAICLSAFSSRWALDRLRTHAIDAYSRTGWQEQTRASETQVSDLVTVQADRAAFLPIVVTSFITSAISGLALVAIAALVSPISALFVAGSLLLIFLALRPLVRLQRRLSRGFSESYVALAKTVGESVHLTREIDLFGVWREAKRRIRRHSEDNSRAYLLSQLTVRTTPAIFQASAFVVLAIGLLLLSGLATSNLTQIGAAVLLAVRALSYGQAAQSSIHEVANSVEFGARIQSQIDGLRSLERPEGSTVLVCFEELEIKNLSYRYVESREALRDISFVIRAGESVALVGPSGSGKSTLIGIILGLIRPTSGEIAVNGVPLDEIRSASLARMFALVPQDPRLLSGTVEETVRFMRQRIDLPTIDNALVLARLRDELGKPGEHEVGGANATGLSGGQAQRVSFARALAGGPDVLVLDEPTAALDARSERGIVEGLRTLKGDATIIIAAHREDTINLCDRIIVLDRGRVQYDGAIGGRPGATNDRVAR